MYAHIYICISTILSCFKEIYFIDNICISHTRILCFQMLIGYQTGQIVLWDLKSRTADYRCQTDEQLKSITWHHEGKQFMCSHANGSLSTWTVRQVKPANVTFPHGEI